MYWILLAGWVCWITLFLVLRKGEPKATQIDRRARIGIVFQVLGFALVWQGRFWLRTPATWQMLMAAALFVLGALLAWTGVLALGRQWRIDAGLNADHDLVTSGPYRLVRHPIYASMFAMFLGTGVLFAPWQLLGTGLLRISGV